MREKDVSSVEGMTDFLKEKTDCTYNEAAYLTRSLLQLHYRFGTKRPARKDVTDYLYEEMATCSGMFGILTRLRITQYLNNKYRWHFFPWSAWRGAVERATSNYQYNLWMYEKATSNR